MAGLPRAAAIFLALACAPALAQVDQNFQTLQTQTVNAANLPIVVTASSPGVTAGQAATGGSATPPNGGSIGLTPTQPSQASSPQAPPSNR